MIDWFPRGIAADDERAIAAFMERLAQAPVPRPAALENHDALWWKAQLLRRWDAQRRAVAPLNVMEPIQMAMSLVAAALILLWALPTLERVLAMLPM